jgi:hypothetical protein
MKSIFPSAVPFSAVLILAALTGCATGQDAEHSQHHPDSATSQMSEKMNGGPGGGQMGMMDVKAMCDMDQKMTGARTPEERQAMMAERLKNMSPEMQRKHMEMMQAQCK